jgi:hypothetical protein
MDDLPSTRYHSPLVENFNREARSRGTEIDLSAEALIVSARQEISLDQFGDESFLPALKRFLESAETEAQLNPFGRFNARMRVLRSLKNRLWAEDCFTAAPEIRRREIAAPIVIVGPHRSGTTRLQHLLATDSRLQHLTTWEGLNPAPRRTLPDQGLSVRRDEIESMLAGAEEAYPGAASAHPMNADWPEEEMLLLNHSFCSFSLIGAYQVPGYYRWFRDADKSFAYRYMADLMKLISWSRQVPENKPWILKNPQHMLDLDILLQVFPDAKLVFTHRDPIKTVGSIMSLVWHYGVQHTDLPCRARVRDVWLDFCEQMARRCMEARENIPAGQQIDVHYEDMNRDWYGQMRRIYDFAGIEWAPEAEAAQAAWLAGSNDRHGGHRYALEDFGTSAQEVDERMMFVRERYGIPYEGR